VGLHMSLAQTAVLRRLIDNRRNFR
jgi:hypothetical protein